VVSVRLPGTVAAWKCSRWHNRNGTTHLATASRDRATRIWNPAKETAVPAIPTLDDPTSVAYADGLLFVGTTTGLLAIRLDPELLNRLGGAKLR
jgi:hypothetical protein